MRSLIEFGKIGEAIARGIFVNSGKQLKNCSTELYNFKDMIISFFIWWYQKKAIQILNLIYISREFLWKAHNMLTIIYNLKKYYYEKYIMAISRYLYYCLAFRSAEHYSWNQYQLFNSCLIGNCSNCSSLQYYFR